MNADLKTKDATDAYGNCPSRHPGLWKEFVKTLPKIGISIEISEVTINQWLPYWNCFLVGASTLGKIR
jgi:hypothetical protein